ncbi:MAG: RepB family plasmid replication initiator protein [Cytophagaceae bacterium]|nr:MAG: RepB family plasmid replication initiator protein [Cytophagaceae bacterium]
MKKELEIWQDNALTLARYEMSETEKNLLYMVVTQVKPEDSESKRYQVSVNQMAEINGSARLKADAYRQATRKLITRVFETTLADGDFLQAAFITSARYKKGTDIIEIGLSPEVRPFYVDLNKKFTKMQLAAAISLNSAYAKRIYELLCMYKNMKDKTFRRNLVDLKTMLWVIDPKTGKRVEGNKAINIAIDCEATDLMYRDGWYYLLGTHGTCCDGANSTYNIVVGRSKKVTGPYLDNMGRDMLKGGGKMVLAAGGRVNGPGHFGRYVVGDGVEKMSCHYEADLDQSGRSVLGIRPLLWKNGWPVGGDNFKEGTYEIESERRGYALELIVDFTRMPVAPRGPNRTPVDEPIKPVPSQELADVVKSWPAGPIGVRIGDYMFRPHQKWTITAAPNSGGYLGGTYYKIGIAGTDRALSATADAEVITVPAFTGAPEQLWRIDQLTDGTYRIMPKVVPNSKENLVLVSSGDSTPTLAPFDMTSDNSKWNFKAH